MLPGGRNISQPFKSRTPPISAQSLESLSPRATIRGDSISECTKCISFALKELTWRCSYSTSFSLRSKRFQSSYCANVRAEAKIRNKRNFLFLLCGFISSERLKPCRHVKNDLSGTIHSAGYKFCRAAALQPVSKRSLQ